jgi:hypothetical protein
METEQMTLPPGERNARKRDSDLQRERESLVAEKAAAERRLVDLKFWKRQAALAITSSRPKNIIEQTQSLEVEFELKRREIVNELTDVNGRLISVKKTMSVSAVESGKNVSVSEVLLRIEKVLCDILLTAKDIRSDQAAAKKLIASLEAKASDIRYEAVVASSVKQEGNR